VGRSKIFCKLFLECRIKLLVDKSHASQLLKDIGMVEVNYFFNFCKNSKIKILNGHSKHSAYRVLKNMYKNSKINSLEKYFLKQTRNIIDSEEISENLFGRITK
jgi:hypothetical protein